MSTRRTFLAATAGATLLPHLHAQAQANTLRWVVPYPPGGGKDGSACGQDSSPWVGWF